MSQSINYEVIKLPRVVSLLCAADVAFDPVRPVPFDVAVLTSEERHMRRRALTLAHGDRVLVDFPDALVLGDRDRLVLEDGRQVEIIAAEEALYAVRGGDSRHLIELAWHIGNRHLAAQIEADRILIPRDTILRTMLEGLGAEVEAVCEPFHPARGAYAGGKHSHGTDSALDVDVHGSLSHPHD